MPPAPEVLPTVPVSGVAYYNGTPLAYFQIALVPEKEGQRYSTGTTTELGQFSLTTNSMGDGAPVGKYKVILNYSGPPPKDSADFVAVDEAPAPVKLAVPSKYSDSATTDLQIEIPPGGLKDWKLEVP